MSRALHRLRNKSYAPHFPATTVTVKGIVCSRRKFSRNFLCQSSLDCPRGVDKIIAHTIRSMTRQTAAAASCPDIIPNTTLSRRRCGRRPGAKGRQRTKHYSRCQTATRRGRTDPKASGHFRELKKSSMRCSWPDTFGHVICAGHARSDATRRRIWVLRLPIRRFVLHCRSAQENWRRHRQAYRPAR